MNRPSHELVFRGLDGGNSLAFLAALGTLRTLTLAWSEDEIALSWSREAGSFRPRLHMRRQVDAEMLVNTLHAELRSMAGHPALGFADNLNVTPSRFREYAISAVNAANADSDKRGGRTWADFAAAFACEATTNTSNKESTVQDTALRTMSGAGHQNFLKFMRDLIAATEPLHLHHALFEDWRYEDEGRGLNMRWDPADDRRYALRWSDPSSDPSRTVRGANRLAIEAIPMLTSIPVGSRLETTGIANRGRDGVFWIWPIWSAPLSKDAVESLLAFGGLQDDGFARLSRVSMGIEAIYRSQRIRIGKFRNFTPAEQV
jgi:hypothetical protein